MKLRLFTLLLLVGAALSSTQAQYTTYLTTGTSWEVAQFNGGIITPALNYNFIMTSPTFNWGAPVAIPDLDVVCYNSTPPFPGTPIFAPGWTDCINTQTPTQLRTAFFRRRFELTGGSNEVCSATLQVKADNIFRVYVDGQLVPGNDLLPCGSSGSFGTFSDLQGNDPTQIYNIDISDFLDLSLSEHTLIVEVGNCNHLHFLSADLRVIQEMSCTPDATINYSFQQTDMGCVLIIGGTSQCYTLENWRVFYRPATPSSSYSLLFSIDENKRIGASRQIPIPYGCGYYRIFHRVWHTRCDGTRVSREVFSNPIYYCCTRGEGGLQQAEDGLLSAEQAGLTINAEPTALPETGHSPAEQVEVMAYPNPATEDLNLRFQQPFTGQVDLIDPLGRVISKQTAEEATTLNFDLSGLASGLYWVVARNGAHTTTIKVMKQL